MKTSVLFCLLLGGCRWVGPGTEVREDSTTGNLGRAELAYFGHHDGACAIGCALDRPLMVGATEGISVVGWLRMPPLTATSTDPSILEVMSQSEQWECAGVSFCGLDCNTEEGCARSGGDVMRSLSFHVRALAEGDASIELIGDDGVVWESVPVSAREATALEIWHQVLDEDSLEVDFLSDEMLVLLLDGPARNNGGFSSEKPLWIRARAADATWLHSSWASPLVSIDDPAIADFNGASTSESADPSLHPRARGGTTLRATAGGVSVEIAVLVE